MKSPTLFPKRKPSTQIHPHPHLTDIRVCSENPNGLVHGYAASTFQGLARNYNEDCVSIVMDIRRNGVEEWPECSYFAVFDGYGGKDCSQFLRDSLHSYITEDTNFPERPSEALRNGFAKAQKEFQRYLKRRSPANRSGSCALVVLIVGETCHVANVGDSRAIVSVKGGTVLAMSNDHKPNCPSQRRRIIEHGGQVYQSMITTKTGDVIPGPYRVLPGRLPISRTLGAYCSKTSHLQSLPNVLISQPQIASFPLTSETHNFLFLGSHSIFQKIQNQQLVDIVFQAARNVESNSQFLRQSIESIMYQSLNRKAMGNLTGIVVQIGGGVERMRGKWLSSPIKGLGRLDENWGDSFRKVRNVGCGISSRKGSQENQNSTNIISNVQSIRKSKFDVESKLSIQKNQKNQISNSTMRALEIKN